MRLAPRLDSFDAAIARRIGTTVSCTDADAIEKVEDAGTIREVDGQRVQVMHNGLLVEEGGYFGDWMAEIIRTLRGHHEPQEELVFDRIVARLKADTDSPTMIEFGSYWTYYGLWFCRAIEGSRVVALEPDPDFIEVGRRNAALNGFTDRVQFFPGAIGPNPGELLAFRAESDGAVHDVATYDLASLMAAGGLTDVDLILSDVQGAETILLDRAGADFDAGRVRFLIVSTHHYSISGDYLTHQNALRLLQDAGAHVIAEHSVTESFSGDGLIAVSFDPRDKDFRVEVSHARARDSLFGEPEFDAARAAARAAEADAVRTQLEQETRDRAALQARLDVIESSTIWRRTRLARAAISRLRGC